MEDLRDKLSGNENIEKAILIAGEKDEKRILAEAIQKQIARKKCFIAPAEKIVSDDGGESISFRGLHVKENEDLYLAVFTSVEEMEKGPSTDYIPCDIRVLLDIIHDADEYKGMVLNPWGNGYVLGMDYVEQLRKNSILHDAIRFATEKHEGQFRKGTMMPYIVHPIETMQILHSMNSNAELLMAGVLHDTMEDADVSYDELELLFGETVANLVSAHSENKELTWEERKETEIQDTIHAPVILKKLVLADKLANLRSIARDYTAIGDELWKRFTKGKEQQAWYYSEIQDALWDMQNYPESKDAYWELVALYKDVFVSYYLEENNGMLYQQDTSGQIYALKKGLPQWKEAARIPKTAIQVERKYAERIEDNWNEPFWKLHEQDLMDARYNLFSSTRRSIAITLQDRKLVFSAEDWGRECEIISGKDEYEFWYALDEENTRRFLVQLRFQYGIRYKLETILKKAFGEDNGPEEFRKFCEGVQVGYHFGSY